MTNPEVERSETDALVDRARAGDVGAFERLVELHQHAVFSLALRLVGNREMAADVAQEAMIRAWRALPRFRGDAAFSTWIHRITVNTAWTLRTRSKRRSAGSLDEAGDVADPDWLTPERAGESAVLRMALQHALARLPEVHRTLVVLKDVEGWTHGEIAEMLGITVTAAKVRLHRAHIKLREYLREEL
ncbi:MAG: sigma-70 family RNA polymerase sigma factor [Gammaproteobacteria bacterium]|nr:sigma-70 family RNA polymerase sigma factor [Gammaproteobacteria bacterium]